jgi:hypothetical protein
LVRRNHSTGGWPRGGFGSKRSRARRCGAGVMDELSRSLCPCERPSAVSRARVADASPRRKSPARSGAMICSGSTRSYRRSDTRPRALHRRAPSENSHLAARPTRRRAVRGDDSVARRPARHHSALRRPRDGCGTLAGHARRGSRTRSGGQMCRIVRAPR